MSRFCRKCGKEIRLGAQFCRNCGEKVRTADVSAQLPVSNSAPSATSASGPVSAPGIPPQMNMTMQMQQQIYANRLDAPITTKDRDPFGALKVLLVLGCLALIVTGAILIPKNIRAARAGRINTEGLVTTISGEANAAGAVLEKGDRALTDKQKEIYAEIRQREEEEDEAARMGIVIEAQPQEFLEEVEHDRYEWFEGDAEGWVEVKEDEE